jgi:hypothetical protein
MIRHTLERAYAFPRVLIAVATLLLDLATAPARFCGCLYRLDALLDNPTCARSHRRILHALRLTALCD